MSYLPKNRQIKVAWLMSDSDCSGDKHSEWPTLHYIVVAYSKIFLIFSAPIYQHDMQLYF